MYDEYYGFIEKPFSISPDPDFLYLNSYYREALSMLRYGIEERKGVVCLVGEVGTGKTMLLNKLLLSMKKEVIVPSVLFPITGFEELVGDLIEQLSVPVVSKHTSGKLQALHRHLLKERRRDRIIVLLIDEAQTLRVESLEGLRHLSNIETPKEKLIQIVLSGQPELKDKLNLPELRQFKQRIANSFELAPLPMEEVSLYIAHRMKIAGNNQVLRLFSEPALSLVANYSCGIPRLINALCENALLIGYALEKRQIDGRIVKEAARDLMLVAHHSPDKAPHFGKPSEGAKKRIHPIKSPPRSNPKKPGGYRHFWKWATVCMVFITMFVISSAWFPRQASEVSNFISQFISNNIVDLREHLGMSVPKYPVVQQSKTKNQVAEPFFRKENVLSIASNDSALSHDDAFVLVEASVLEKNKPAGIPVIDGEKALSLGPYENPDTEILSDISGPLDSPFGNELPVLPSIPEPVTEFHKTDPANTKPIETGQKVPATLGRTMLTGETISQVALEEYGFLNSYVYGMIHLANPDIRDLDLILSGQTVLFPPLIPNSRIFSKNNVEYYLFINACQDIILAEKWKNRLAWERETRVGINIVWITSAVKLYLLEIEGYQNRDEALRRLEALARIPSIAEILEERRDGDSEVLTKYNGPPMGGPMR